MNANDLLRFNIKLTHSVTEAYLSDLSDDDLLVRPAPNANHLAWQLGHLIASEHQMLGEIGAEPPALPDGFADAHGRETGALDDTDRYLSIAEYRALMDSMHDCALATIDRMSESDFDAPGPERMEQYLKNVGQVLLMIGAHEMMHTGQFAVIRRVLGKPVVI